MLIWPFIQPILIWWVNTAELDRIFWKRDLVMLQGHGRNLNWLEEVSQAAAFLLNCCFVLLVLSRCSTTEEPCFSVTSTALLSTLHTTLWAYSSVAVTRGAYISAAPTSSTNLCASLVWYLPANPCSYSRLWELAQSLKVVLKCYHAGLYNEMTQNSQELYTRTSLVIFFCVWFCQQSWVL